MRKPYQVIIADGGHNLEPILSAFVEQLNLVCLYCPEAGQILQRNHAHKYLDKNIQLVLHLDDDITLDHDSLRKMIIFWNKESQNKAVSLAGVSFNIKNAPQLQPSAVRKLFFLQTKPAGHVTLAGYAAPYAPTRRIANLLVGWRCNSVVKRHYRKTPTPHQLSNKMGSLRRFDLFISAWPQTSFDGRSRC